MVSFKLVLFAILSQLRSHLKRITFHILSLVEKKPMLT